MNKLSIIVLSILFISVQTIFAQEKNSIGMELRAISKGEFYMGSDGLGENYDEAPIHKVTMSKPFLMGATMFDLAGSAAFNKLRGHSLILFLQGNSSSPPGFAFSESHSEGNCTGSFMIRKGDWKYIHFSWYDDLLFNVIQDPGEFNNLINKPETADIKAELKNILYSMVDPEEVTLRAFHTQEKNWWILLSA